VNFNLKKIGKRGGVIIAASAVAIAVGGYALAATAHPNAVTPAGTSEFTVCAKNSNNVPVRIYNKNAGCSTGYHKLTWEAQGQKGDPGKDAIQSLTAFPAGTLNTPVVLSHVGGSIRTGVTDLGNVTLNAGTYDAKVLSTFYRKVNTSSDPAFTNIETYGTLVIWTGPAILPDFSNDTTLGGVLIPKVNSTTLTIDPGANLDATIKIAADNTPVHVGVFAYNDNSGSAGTTGQPGAGDFSAVLQSATFALLNVN